MTSRENPTATPHDPTEKPLLEELPDALALVEQQLDDLTRPPHNMAGTVLRARTEISRIIMQIRQSAPAELEVQWLRVPVADRKTIISTVDRALAGDPSGNVLDRKSVV